MNYAIILAAGEGKRLKSTHQTKEDKMLLLAGQKPVIYHSLITFNDHPDIDQIILVAGKHNKTALDNIAKDFGLSKVKNIILGGETRQESVNKAFQLISKKAKNKDLIIVHNGANPLVTQDEVAQVLDQTRINGSCIVGHYATSTLKEIHAGHILKTHDRNKFFAAETPQAVEFSLFKKALDKAKKSKFEATDEAMLVENLGQKVAYIEASEHNFKITTYSDYLKLKAILGDLPEDFRVGIGQDSHMFETEEKGLTLGGIKIPDENKLKANSDGDVILHAIFNALSQAIGEMSLGFYADEEFANGITDSKKYLEIVLKKIKKQDFKINSLGLMLECKHPKIDPLVPKLKKSLSAILNLEPKKIGITATTGEHLTLFGVGKGIQCFAIASLVKD
ncbi:MAG: 2-C-methyl-D-erythritol 2,4-cyclodiphosphate synthase [Patescibacteria group bacterium]